MNADSPEMLDMPRAPGGTRSSSRGWPGDVVVPMISPEIAH